MGSARRPNGGQFRGSPVKCRPRSVAAHGRPWGRSGRRCIAPIISGWKQRVDLLSPRDCISVFRCGSSSTVDIDLGYFVAGDFNGDGFLDLAATNPIENTISILLGDSLATLPGIDYTYGSQPLLNRGGRFQRGWESRRGGGQQWKQLGFHPAG
jgi:hypothetical protein